MNMVSTLIVNDLSITVGDRKLLSDASFSLEEGKLTVLVGVSGGGKSTLLRILTGLESDSQSSDGLQWHGEMKWLPEDASEHIGLVFQQPALLDHWSSIANVRLAIEHRRPQKPAPKKLNSGFDVLSRIMVVLRRSSKSNSEEAIRWLDHMHVPTDVPIPQLSGGQRQRLSLAQTLAGKPGILFYDEPTTGLDSVAASRVAVLIRQIQQEQKVTTLVVTHDYESFIEVADSVLVIDKNSMKITPLALPNADSVHQELLRQTHEQKSSFDENSLALSASYQVKTHQPTESRKSFLANRFFEATLIAPLGWLGTGIEWVSFGILATVPRWHNIRWGLRFLLHYANLVFGATAIIYLGIAGLIVGFVTTYFTFRYMPYKVYTEPLLTEELIGAIGFSLYRIFVPILASILIAARCAAAVSADIGNKRYGGQIEAMQLMGVAPSRYIFTGVMWSFLIGTILLEEVAFFTARWTSLAVHLAMQPNLGVSYWDLFFHQPLRTPDNFLYSGFWWVLFKLLLCGMGTAILTYSLAMQRKKSSSDVSRTITTTILWCTLWVLAVHLIVALYEFRV